MKTTTTTEDVAQLLIVEPLTVFILNVAFRILGGLDVKQPLEKSRRKLLVWLAVFENATVEVGPVPIQANQLIGDKRFRFSSFLVVHFFGIVRGHLDLHLLV